MLGAAYSIFLANVIVGLLVKTHVITSSRFRLMHHVLYFFVMASLLAATVATFIHGSAAYAWQQVGMAAILLGMPLFRGRSSGHWMYATFCCAAYSALVFWH